MIKLFSMVEYKMATEKPYQGWIDRLKTQMDDDEKSKWLEWLTKQGYIEQDPRRAKKAFNKMLKDGTVDIKQTKSAYYRGKFMEKWYAVDQEEQEADRGRRVWEGSALVSLNDRFTKVKSILYQNEQDKIKAKINKLKTEVDNHSSPRLWLDLNGRFHPKQEFMDELDEITQMIEGVERRYQLAAEHHKEAWRNKNHRDLIKRAEELKKEEDDTDEQNVAGAQAGGSRSQMNKTVGGYKKKRKRIRTRKRRSSTKRRKNTKKRKFTKKRKNTRRRRRR